MAKLKSLRKIIVKKDCKDIKGWTIPKGTTLHVVDDSLPKAPFGDNHQILVVRIDNGTGDLKLMPEAFVRDKDI